MTPVLASWESSHVIIFCLTWSCFVSRDHILSHVIMFCFTWSYFVSRDRILTLTWTEKNHWGLLRDAQVHAPQVPRSRFPVDDTCLHALLTGQRSAPPYIRECCNMRGTGILPRCVPWQPLLPSVDPDWSSRLHTGRFSKTSSVCRGDEPG